jgi:hypothetical protein
MQKTGRRFLGDGEERKSEGARLMTSGPRASSTQMMIHSTAFDEQAGVCPWLVTDNLPGSVRHSPKIIGGSSQNII